MPWGFIMCTFVHMCVCVCQLVFLKRGVLVWISSSSSSSSSRPGTCRTFRRPHSSPATPKSLCSFPLTHKQTSTPTQPPPSAGSAGGWGRRRGGQRDGAMVGWMEEGEGRCWEDHLVSSLFFFSHWMCVVFFFSKMEHCNRKKEWWRMERKIGKEVGKKMWG